MSELPGWAKLDRYTLKLSQIVYLYDWNDYATDIGLTSGGTIRIELPIEEVQTVISNAQNARSTQ